MITKPKGTYDLYGKKGSEFLFIQGFIEELMDKYNYEFFRTPLFEASELFHRGVGETTDIVTKETYDFVDRGKRNMTLRPEGTAGLVRSYIENKLYSDPILPKKFWYLGSMYRYERPQSGRYREHNQFGIEVFGSSDPFMDAEVINVAVSLFRLLGLKGIKVNINSLGDRESRELYKEALHKYLEPKINELCEDCQVRFSKNPLRILDCKFDAENKILKNIPKTVDYLNDVSKTHFEKLQEYLSALEIDFIVSPKTVRGFDYYTHTVFEIEADVKGFGAQNVMCGGGRYDNLVENLGGPSIPGVGFGLGVERLMAALEYENINLVNDFGVDVYIQPISENEKSFAIALTQSLRMLGFKTETDYMNRNIKANFKQADRLNAKFVITIGEEEIKNNKLTVKNLVTKTEEKVDNMAIVEYLSVGLEKIYEEKFHHTHSCDCGCDHDEDSDEE